MQHRPQQPAAPPVAVLICTRNRGDSIAATIASVLANPYPDFELIIVDQSGDDRTAAAVGRFRADPRLRYLHTSSRGLARARNLGLALIRHDLVLLTDDDCEVPANWIAEMVAPFLRHPQVGIVFCDVVAGPHDRSLGFVPVNQNPRAQLIAGLARWRTSDGVNIGIGAGMAIRRSAAAQIAGFDPLFGSGSHFRSGDDLDFTMRLLAAGRQIYRTDRAAVVHHGFRTYDEGRRLIRSNMFSVGAIYGRMLRRGHWHALRHYFGVLAAMVILPAVRDLARLRRPPVLGRAIWLCRGLIDGLRLPPGPAATRAE
jgi:GT2 family glycosyltransferase